MQLTTLIFIYLFNCIYTPLELNYYYFKSNQSIKHMVHAAAIRKKLVQTQVHPQNLKSDEVYVHSVYFNLTFVIYFCNMDLSSIS